MKNIQYKEVFFATSDPTKDFNEYMVKDPLIKKTYFLDFYIKDTSKAIEFDGDYWHGEKRGNQVRDKKREESLRALGYADILHVKERDYRANPSKVLQECLEFIRGRKKEEEREPHAEESI